MTLIPAAAVEPEADEAREWLIRELARPVYDAARPSWFDLLVERFWEWLQSIQIGGTGGTSPVLFAVIALIVAAILLLAFRQWGAPHPQRRGRGSGVLFGEDDERDAATIRAAALAAAAAGDHALATTEMFRAVARALEERTIVTASPGTTARAFAVAAGAAFPNSADELVDASAVFDGVRYLGAAASADDFASIRELDRQLGAATPELDAVGRLG